MANDDPILRYYEAEMRYLRESGKEFAKAHPDRARLLNLDRVGDRDPYVERLFEGFAFLTGRLRQKLDDELPELTEGLVSLLWPHYLRMIPSLSVVELISLSEKLQKTEIVPAGVSIRSAPIVVPPPAGASALATCAHDSSGVARADSAIIATATTNDDRSAFSATDTRTGLDFCMRLPHSSSPRRAGSSRAPKASTRSRDGKSPRAP